MNELQNDFTKQGSFKVIKILKNNRNKCYDAIIEVDNDTYNAIMNHDEKLNIGWNRCNVK